MSKVSGSNVTELLEKLVAFPTISGHMNATNDCFDYLEAYLAERNLHLTRANCNTYPSLIATTQPTKTPKVLLQAHIDVVPAPADSFLLREKSGKLYGRGTFDMKFAAACYLQLVEELKDHLDTYDFGIMFTSDEEIGGKNGVCYLLEQGYGADICILPDGGNNWQIETSCNAVWIIQLIASGQTAHGSRPWEGSNAILQLTKALHEIQDIFGVLEANKNSVSINKIHGGSALNQVPDYAEAVIDMRFTSDEEFKKYHRRINAIARNHGLGLETIAQVAARNVAIDQKEIQDFLTIAKGITGQEIHKTHSLGASDACYFAERSIPTIVIRPTGGGAHSLNEWIDKAELSTFYEVIKSYVTGHTKLA